MGEKQNQPFQLSFNASLKVDFQGSRVTSDGGLILVRELDERLGFSELIEQRLTADCGITETARQEEAFINNEAREGEVSEKSLRAAAVPGGKGQ
jgi:hypothetical protein